MRLFFVLFFLFTQSDTRAQSVFHLAENGVTIKCPGARPGDTGVVNGTEYEAVSRDLLILRIRQSNVAHVCTTPVTDMSSIFGWAEAFTFNAPIGHWDTSNVTDMSEMFAYSMEFNQPIGMWNTGNVTTMNGMFMEAGAFNQPIGMWDVRKVTDLADFAAFSRAFNQDLSGWCVAHLSETPPQFSEDSRLEEAHLPRWGTCPSR